MSSAAGADDVWRSDDPDYAVIDWRAVRYFGITWNAGNGIRATTARVLDMELRDGRPVIEARDLPGRRLLVLDPHEGALRKRVDGEEVELGALGLVETRDEQDVREEWQGIDGHEPEEDVHQSGLNAWGVRA